jgi:hypothetical protein
VAVAGGAAVVAVRVAAVAGALVAAVTEDDGVIAVESYCDEPLPAVDCGAVADADARPYRSAMAAVVSGEVPGTCWAIADVLSAGAGLVDSTGVIP